jgi:hypothetical protein
MTKLLREAFDIASKKYKSQQLQDRLAYLMIKNMDRLYEMLEEEADERNFDACAIEAVSSKKIQALFGKVAEKYNSQNL